MDLKVFFKFKGESKKELKISKNLHLKFSAHSLKYELVLLSGLNEQIYKPFISLLRENHLFLDGT